MKTTAKFIEEDLLYAVDNLPYAKDDASRSDNRFRLSKGAAMGLLAKVYATWAGQPVNDESKWEKAAQIAGELILRQTSTTQRLRTTLEEYLQRSVGCK